jgi:2-hydroxychromene-2-carboxylate isomerase
MRSADEAPMAEPVFYYDFNSPFAYIAAHRVDDVLPVQPRWQPIALAFLLIAQRREPWSFDLETREPTMRDCERRAAALGLPLEWPDGWPRESYSLLPLRAATFAKQTGRVVAFSLAAFRQTFAAGRPLNEPDNVLLAAAACELHPKAVLKGIETQAVKAALREATEEALERGVQGVPTLAVDGELFWGDDRLEAAAAALRR